MMAVLRCARSQREAESHTEITEIALRRRPYNEPCTTIPSAFWV